MVWFILLILLILILAFLLSPVECTVDTRVSMIVVRWAGIGKAMLEYDNDEWWLRMQVFFIKWNWQLGKTNSRGHDHKKPGKKLKKHTPSHINPQKIFDLIKTFQVVEWEIAFDSDDIVKNAWLYPLNFHPCTRQHIHINFMDENYLLLTIRNVPLRMLYAWIK